MKQLLLVLFLLLQMPCDGQRGWTIYPNNVLSGESGMFHRGLIGVSYKRLFVHNHRWIIGSGAGIGIGGIPGASGVNQFYYNTNYIAIRVMGDYDHDFFITGTIDVQYIDYNDTEYYTMGNETWSEQVDFTLFRVMPYLGISHREDNFLFEMRFPPLALFNQKNESAVKWGGVGISVGWLF